MTSKKQIIAFSRKQDQDVSSLVSISLPCPRTGELTTYLYEENTTRIFELSKVAEGRKACWLVGNSIYKDGALHFITPIDPLFIVLRILARHKAQQKGKDLYRTMDDIFTIAGVSSQDIQLLIGGAGFSEQLGHLCDTQEVGDMMVYRYNKEKCLEWLKQKVDILVQQFDMIPQLKNNLDDLTDEKEKDHRLRESIYVLAKYLSDDWIKELFQCYEGLTEEAIDETEETQGDNTNDQSVDDYFKLASNKSKTIVSSTETSPKKHKPATPRSLANVNTKGIKPLTSFFKSK